MSAYRWVSNPQSPREYDSIKIAGAAWAPFFLGAGGRSAPFCEPSGKPAIGRRENLWYKSFFTEGMQGSEQLRTSESSGAGASQNRRRGFFETRYWLRDLVLSLFLAFIFVIFLYQPVQVEGTSMQPQLSNHERIFINKFVYRFEPIRRGDIVVFHFPLEPSKSYIKRVVGLPGETVSIRDGQVYINGRALKEPYVLPAFVDHQSYAPVTLQPDHYFVLGDHRDSSNDSREWGSVDRSYIYGKAVFVYWPFSQFGSLE